MAAQTVKYLKEDRGRFFYRRRVPKRHQKTLGIKVWTKPCGDVSYVKAVVLVFDWAEKHDKLLADLEDPQTETKARRVTETNAFAPVAAHMVNLIEILETNTTITGTNFDGDEVTYDLSKFDPLEAAKAGIKAADSHPTFDSEDKLIRYRAILEASFGKHIDPPNDPDNRDEFELVKKKLERRIAGIAGDPNTISAIAPRYYKFAGIRPIVEGKYRRNIQKLIDHVSDLPVKHVTPKMLRGFRDTQATTMKASSLSAVFTPIRGLFSFAMEEDLIEINPMASVQLQKEKRSIDEIKWKPFTPQKMQRILIAMEDNWSKPVQGMMDQRRRSIWMVCRVMAFSALRPIEVIRLQPEDVNDRWIKVRESKTQASTRTVPLHPKISDLPAFIQTGGLKTFQHIKTDKVHPVRHNFERLIRDLMDPPIADKRKVLYSFRTTFSNAMRRAGGDGEVRRAILGHREAGALARYDDGPEFAKKRQWVQATDPMKVYPDDDYDEWVDDDLD